MTDYYCSRCRRDDCNGFHKCFVSLRSRIRPKDASAISPLVKKIAACLKENGYTIRTDLKHLQFERVYQRASAAEKTQGAWCWALQHRLLDDIIINNGEFDTKMTSVGSHFDASILTRGPMTIQSTSDFDISIIPADETARQLYIERRFGKEFI